MIDFETLDKNIGYKQDSQKQGGGRAAKWRLVPIGYLVECVEERAAIMEHDGGMTRQSAERAAYDDGAKRFRVYELAFE